MYQRTVDRIGSRSPGFLNNNPPDLLAAVAPHRKGKINPGMLCAHTVIFAVTDIKELPSAGPGQFHIFQKRVRIWLMRFRIVSANDRMEIMTDAIGIKILFVFLLRFGRDDAHIIILSQQIF